MKELLSRLVAIENTLKTIHYKSKGDNFWSDHIFSDSLLDGLSTFRDDINEICFLGEGEEAPLSKDVLTGALDFIPDETKDDLFSDLEDLISSTLEYLEKLEDLSRGENALMDNISEDLQKKLGLIHRRLL